MNPLHPLLNKLREQFDFDSLLAGGIDGTPNRRPAAIQSYEAAHLPILAALASSRPTPTTQPPVTAVVSTSAAAELAARELSVWLGADRVELFPGWETFPFERISPTFQSMGERLRILARLQDPDPAQAPAVLVVPVGALTQRLVPDSLKITPLKLRVGQDVDRDQLIEQLVSGGYRRCPQVEHRGNLAVRGSIVDIFPSTAAHPIRLDFWGDTIERLCEFSLTNQRSLSDLDDAVLFPCRELLPTESVRERAGRMQAEAPWANQWWQKLEQKEMFDGMESYLPWLVDAEVVLGDLLPLDSLMVEVGPVALARRAAEIQTEESQLVAALAETWLGGETDSESEQSQTQSQTQKQKRNKKLELPNPLHVSYDRALENFAGQRLQLTSEGAGGETEEETETPATSRSSVSRKSSKTKSIAARSWTQTLTGFGEGGPLPVLTELLDQRYHVTVTASTPNSAQRVAAQLGNSNIHLPVLSVADSEASGVIAAGLQHGFILDDAQLAVLTESELTGKKRRRRSTLGRAGLSNPEGRIRFQPPDAADPNASDLTPSEILRASVPFEIDSYVVHRQHGIAKYGGIISQEINGALEDYLSLEYRGSDRLFIPINQLDAIRPYTGGETPRLSRMGGSDWQRTTSKARAAAAEVADELVALYQHRQISDGFAFPSDSVWQTELEDSFPFEETPDQLHTITQVKADMERPQPMDRLVCGDVGFGKTEIAVRAAFKAVSAGKQVAVLVPTTLLAQQHFETFTDRFGSLPVRAEMLSRFTPPADVRRILTELAAGEVQLVIGTHRLLSKDVAFADLGLLVLDEEQRFGVKHKETIKSLRANVDVLTMTATPIPRTLELSLTGIRDLSTINTPPQERKPVFTFVGTYDQLAVAEAIKRELLREGQVLYVHNRVANIDFKARELAELVPQARFAVAHGQMGGAELEQVVGDFADQRYDVLVCTTIIESGIDIATANTLIVDHAHKFGLAQLHQLRGRVGRSHQRAYAYLFTPPEMRLSPEAYERLKTIEEHTELGAGALVAMRDLELRGAGNLLGVGQSGHIAAVGYDLYCQLVSEKVAELKGEPPPPSLELDLDLLRQTRLPGDYIAHEATRLEAYRNVAAVQTDAEAEDLGAQWRDRFGELPPEALALLDVARLRAACFRYGINEVKVRRDVQTKRLVARLHPVVLPLSRQARLERMFRGSSWNEGGRMLTLALSDASRGAAEMVAALDELLGEG